jgi:hypothetical protein
VLKDPGAALPAERLEGQVEVNLFRDDTAQVGPPLDQGLDLELVRAQLVLMLAFGGGRPG